MSHHTNPTQSHATSGRRIARTALAAKTCARFTFAIGLGMTLATTMGGCPTPSDVSGDSQAQQTIAGADGAQGLMGLDGAQGPGGPQGAAGADGQQGIPGVNGDIFVYGDGSRGDVAADDSTPFQNTVNLQFQNLTINSGATVGFPSGTVIYCKGDFVNNGTIAVDTGASGGFTGSGATNEDTLTFAYQPPHPGWSPRLPTNGEVATDLGAASGGFGGNALPQDVARWLLQPGLFGGGGGANGSGGAGGSGGGAIVILVEGTFINNGTIGSSGQRGSGRSGGGGGGIIVIASRTEIVNNGGIEALGGIGNPGGAFGSGATGVVSGAGGGGGGGIVHLLSPVVTVGFVDVSGGTGGAAGATGTGILHTAGSGGGGCGGRGGNGATVGFGALPTVPASQSGGDGLILIDEMDPTALF